MSYQDDPTKVLTLKQYDLYLPHHTMSKRMLIIAYKNMLRIGYTRRLFFPGYIAIADKRTVK